MTTPKAPATEEELLECLIELFSEAELETPETIDAFLREAGLNPDEVGARAKKVAEEVLAHSPLNWRNRAQRELEEEKKRRAQTPLPQPKSRTDILSAIEAIMNRSEAANQRVVAQWRNLEKATDEDLLSLLADLEYLEQQSRPQAGESGD